MWHIPSRAAGVGRMATPFPMGPDAPPDHHLLIGADFGPQTLFSVAGESRALRLRVTGTAQKR